MNHEAHKNNLRYLIEDLEELLRSLSPVELSGEEPRATVAECLTEAKALWADIEWLQKLAKEQVKPEAEESDA